jgi:hypothetical protein
LCGSPADLRFSFSFFPSFAVHSLKHACLLTFLLSLLFIFHFLSFSVAFVAGFRDFSIFFCFLFLVAHKFLSPVVLKVNNEEKIVSVCELCGAYAPDANKCVNAKEEKGLSSLLCTVVFRRFSAPFSDCLLLFLLVLLLHRLVLFC